MFLLTVLIVAVAVSFNWNLASTPIDISLLEQSSNYQKSNLETGDLALSHSAHTEVSQTFSRPLFSPTRRPYVTRLEKEEIQEVNELPTDIEFDVVDASDPFDVTVLGIQFSNTSQRALIRSNLTGEAAWVSAGERFNGWTLRSATANAAYFENGEQGNEIFLYQTDRFQSGVR